MNLGITERRDNPFHSDLAEFTCKRTYARFLHEEGRREKWYETVRRCIEFLNKVSGGRLRDEDNTIQKIYDGIYSLSILPSMRLLWSAGKCAELSNSTAYNCSYMVVDDKHCAGELMYNLMSAAGVGFSVERKFTNKLPIVKDFTKGPLNIVTIDDSKEGWSLSLHTLVDCLYSGMRVKFDYSKIRPKGARLMTMGGTASGPEPLKNCHNFITAIFMGAIGRKLKPVEWLEIMCIVADAVLVGGVRRSALIALTDLDDTECSLIKSGSNWFADKKYLANCNISAVYEEKPTEEVFKSEWQRIKDSGTGERGIYSRYSVRSRMSEMRKARIGEHGLSRMGTNPCAEIDLQDMQFCNLSEVVIRPNDNFKTVKNKVALATIIGTVQSMLVDFKFLRPEWSLNCSVERLLGVSLTGQTDNVSLMTEKNLKAWAEHARQVNKKYAAIMGIPESSAITCVKPSGTASIVVDCAAGAHLRWSPFYIRRIKIEKSNPLFRMIKDQGGLVEDDYSDPENFGQVVFPMKSPDGALCRNDVSGIDQIKYWMKLKENWTDHNPSITIYLAENEWDEVGKFLYENFEHIGGLSFFPKTDTVFPQLPYEEIDENRYNELMKLKKKIDFDLLSQYEKDDTLGGSREYACVSGNCEI